MKEMLKNIDCYCRSIHSKKCVTIVWRMRDISYMVWRYNGKVWISDFFKECIFENKLSKQRDYILHLKESIPQCYAMNAPIRISVDVDTTYWKSEIIAGNLKNRDIMKYGINRIKAMYDMVTIKYFDYEIGAHIDKLKSIFYSALSDMIMKDIGLISRSPWLIQFIGIDLCLVVRYLVDTHKIRDKRKVCLIIYCSLRKIYCEIGYGVITDVINYNDDIRDFAIEMYDKSSHIFFIGHEDDYQNISQNIENKKMKNKLYKVSYTSAHGAYSKHIKKPELDQYLGIIHQELLHVQ